MPHHQPRDDHNNDQGSMRTTPVKGTQEVPATAPIFEGHLYLQHPEKSGRWQWRLFRFDGTSFTCLSTRKIKLPPDTPVDATPNDHTLVQSLSSHQLNQHQQHNINHSTSFHTSHTSPLLATPKDKTLRLVSMTSASMPDLPAIATTSSNTNEPMLASYYQLPKWTVDIANISAISVLKGSKKRSPFSSNSSKSKCFCIRTYDGQCHVMKAQKYKDLERWLFVLTKMWRFVQTIRDQMQKQQQQQQPVVVMQPQSTPQPPTSSYPPHANAMFMHPSSWEQQQPTFAARTFDNTMTARNLVPPPPPPPPHIHDNTIVPTTSSPPPAVGIPSLTQPHHQQQQSTQYDARYKAPMLSMEKVHWIDQWRESLAELAAYDQKAVSPPPIEPIPDDDQVSSISGLTSISHRERSPAAAATTAPRRSIVTPRRKASKRSIRSITASMKRVAGGATHPTTDGGTIKSNSIAPANASSAAIMPQELPLEDRPSSSLKKKRSDEVKNWITSNKTEEIVIVGPDMDYFQDANTVLEKEESVNADADYRAAIRYHTSIRGRNHCLSTATSFVLYAVITTLQYPTITTY
ncbi:hypothetical protein K492DRAFT_240885 [Lichtheimia hyalospora FSU 10163]|nr:hypothetical protein K492DRAFT_240885 [Lichtheimia hyalospora FSU 10163]